MISFEWINFNYKGITFEKAGLYVSVLINNEIYFLQVDTGSFNSFLYNHKLVECNLFKEKINAAKEQFFNYTNFSGIQKIISFNVNFNNEFEAEQEFIISEEEEKLNVKPSSSNPVVDKHLIGIIGNDFFSKYNYFNINYILKKITFTSLPSKCKLITKATFEKHSNLVLMDSIVNETLLKCYFDTAAANFTIFSQSFLKEILPNFKEIVSEEIEIFRPETRLNIYKVNKSIEFKIGSKKFNLKYFYYLEDLFDKELFHIESKGKCFIGNELFKEFIVSINYLDNTFALYK